MQRSEMMPKEIHTSHDLAAASDLAKESTPRPEPLWHVTGDHVGYLDAVAQMDTWASACATRSGPEYVWLLEHPSLYTFGRNSDPQHLRKPDHIPVVESGRGGEFTYHGPGQRVVYLILDLRTRFDSDVRAYVNALESWIIAALAKLDITGERGDGARGVWVGRRPELEKRAKIASIGIRVRHGITMHGLSINVNPDLSYFDGIVACGGAGEHQTRVSDILPAKARSTAMTDVDQALRATFFQSVLNRA